MSETGGLSDAHCPVCGAAFDRRVPYPRSTPDPLPIPFEEIAVCPGCGTGMALPRSNQAALDAYYAGGEYWSGTVGDSRVQSFHERNQCRHRVRLALDHVRGRRDLRVLDVGAGHGWTREWIETLAPDALAAFEFVEPDPARSREILARSPRALRVPSLGEARAGYDLIFLNHVLEHVADPLACVAQVTGLLDANGVAYVEMPHADQRFKRDVFPHTWFFTLPGLARLEERTGVKSLLREAFGRLPLTAEDLVNRAGFRLSAALGLASLAGAFDDRLWGYAPAADGIWLRWIVRRASPPV